MNIRNESDEALDEALSGHLVEVFDTYFKDQDEVKLVSDLQRAGQLYIKAQKALDEL